MSERFFTSDNHFGHKNILKFQKEEGTRQGENIEEMNELMIQNWNEQVAPVDDVYCLGDFSFLKTHETIEILSRLNGKIHLIKGNHDYWINHDAIKQLESFQLYKEMKFDKKFVVMFHYPIVQFNKCHHGAYHLYGHVHGTYQHPGKAMDVGIDARVQKDMKLFTWDEIKDFMKDRPIIPHI